MIFLFFITSYANIKQFTQAVDPSDPEFPMPDVSVSWSDVAWLKSITRLPVIIKGPSYCC